MSEILETLEIKNKKIVLDFVKNNYVTINTKQYDNDTRLVPIQLTHNGQPVMLDSSKFYACIKMRTPDNRPIFNKVKIDDSDGTLLLTLTETMLYYPGKAEAEIRIYEYTEYEANLDIQEDDIEHNGKLLSTMNFNIVINASPYSDDAIIASDEFNALTDVMDKALKDYTDVMTHAQASADAAKKSEMSAAESATAAQNSAIVASDYAALASDKADEASVSANAAEQSAKNALQSEENAKASEDVAIEQATIATDKAAEALTSEQNAKASEDKATIKADEAEQSAINASNSEIAAADKAKEAEEFAELADASATIAVQKAEVATKVANMAKEKAEEASVHAENALKSETEASDSAALAKSYAIGTGGVARFDDDMDNAKYYHERTKAIAKNLGGLIYMGTITFEELSNPENQEPNYMFNISNSFVTDSTFKGVYGISYEKGTNVCRTADGYWDVLTVSAGNTSDKVSETEPTDQVIGAFWMKEY